MRYNPFIYPYFLSLVQIIITPEFNEVDLKHKDYNDDLFFDLNILVLIIPENAIY